MLHALLLLPLFASFCSRQVAVSEFKGTYYVNVREYYEKVRGRLVFGFTKLTQVAVVVCCNLLSLCSVDT
jgi:hypothetical protein